VAINGPNLDTQYAKALEFIRKNQNQDGGWAYLQGNPSVPEPTCYAAMALDDAAKGAVWIQGEIDHRDSSATNPQWTRALALLALHTLNSSRELQRSLAQDLLKVRVQRLEPSKLIDLDGGLRGWAWLDDTFSWVEPTSYALLALKKSGNARTERVKEAERLLLDRACSDGGWNYGNRKVYEAELPSMAAPTALAILALQNVPSAASQIARALNRLEDEIARRPSALGLSMAIVSFDVAGRPSNEAVDALLKRQQSDGSWRGQVHLTALSALALQLHTKGTNVFKL
jgi:hypothetical protein